MARRNIDPRKTNVSIDSCAFDPKYYPENKASNTLFKLSEENEIIILVAHSTDKEIMHPNTPQWVKKEAQMKLKTTEVSLTNEESLTKQKILQILTGNGKVSNNIQDSENVFEASKYGSYFVTTDENIIKKSQLIIELTNLVIVKPSQMLEIYNEFKHT